MSSGRPFGVVLPEEVKQARVNQDVAVATEAGAGMGDWCLILWELLRSFMKYSSKLSH